MLLTVAPGNFPGSEGGRGGNCPRQAAIDVLPRAVKGQIRIRIIFRAQSEMNIVTAGAEKRERQAKAVTGRRIWAVGT
jgi:hypothetical protein